MSFDRLSNLESQPTTSRRQDDSTYRDDPEFQQFTEGLSNRLFELVSNVGRLSNEVAKLGTSRDTERVRERVHDLLEETRSGYKDVGEGIKKAQAWDDLNVSPSHKMEFEIANNCSRHRSTPTRNYHENSLPL